MRAMLVAIVLGACVVPAQAPAPAPPRDVLQDVLASPDLDGRAIAEAGPPGDAPRATVLIVFASWCVHCHEEIATLDALRARHPGLRVIGVNYRGHEEYDARGNAEAVRNYVRDFAPWMRVVPAGEPLFTELGRPPKVPTIYVYDARGALVQIYDRQYREAPGAGELDQLFDRLGA
ncbi:MAG TPA: TlpA disulfide reductase family protein [Kofleriaceae bacterium]|nr:TlpA disulfide reductase family protein [Kofleriaceae bacterium]